MVNEIHRLDPKMQPAAAVIIIPVRAERRHLGEDRLNQRVR
jgi:hypothetical protein